MRPTIRPRCRTYGCGTGTHCRTRCARSRKSAPTTTFPTSTSIAMTSTARLREVMLAARELNIDKLPESSRNWINEKLIYTHGYGITMNPVNGFTPEGLPTLISEQHAGAEHGSWSERDSPGNLFRRADQYRRLRKNAAEGIQLSAGRRATTLPPTRARAASCWAASCAASLSPSTAATWPSCLSAMM